MKKQLLLVLICLSATVAYSQNFKFGKVSKEELSEKYYALDSTANAAYLYKSRNTYYDLRNGVKIITDVVQRIKIYNKDGFSYATIGVNYYKPGSGNGERVSSIKATTFNLIDGKIEKKKITKANIFDEKVNKSIRKKKITFPNVKEGSIIEIKYRLSSPYYQSIDDLRFQYNIPVKNLSYSVSIPEYFVFNKRSKGYHYIPMESTKKSVSVSGSNYTNDISTFKASNIPALKDDEPYTGNINNYRAGLIFEITAIVIPGQTHKYFSTTWKDVTKTIYKSSNFGNELKKINYFKDDLATILSEAKSPSQKIGAIFNFVKSKVKWNSYYGIGTNKGVKKAYKEGTGNVAEINLMLTSMLRAAGLEANPVLVSTRSKGFPFFPTIDGFNYVIAAVNLPNGQILLDASEKYSMPNVLPVRAINWQGRIIKNDLTSDWISLTPNVFAELNHFLSVKFDEELVAEGIMRTTYKNFEAVNFRASKNHIKEDGIITKLEENYNIEIDDYKVANKLDNYKPVIRTVKFVGEEFVEMINGKLYISPLLFLASKTNPFKLKERKFPVDFGVPLKNKTSMSLQIPKGYKIESLPESTAIAMSNKIGVFRYKVVSNGQKVNIIFQLQINNPLITPENYQELKEFYNQMVKKQIEKIVLVKE